MYRIILLLAGIHVNPISNGIIPKSHLTYDIVMQHLMSYVNHSIDPCDDFYAHVCPPEDVNFYVNLDEAFQFANSYTELDYVNESDVLSDLQFEDFERYSEKDLVELCNQDLESFLKTIVISRYFVENNYTRIEFSDNCTIMAPMLNEIRMEYIAETSFSFFRNIYKHLRRHRTIQRIYGSPTKADQLFEDLRKELDVILEETPWIKTYNAMEKYKKQLEIMQYYTLGYSKEAVEKQLKKALPELKKFTENEIKRNNITQFIALGYDAMFLSNISDNRLISIYQFYLLELSNHVNYQYGTFGFILAHEIMHSFVFDEDDRSPLKNYSTKNAHCILSQHSKTCQMFPEAKCSTTNRTFEEDAADLMGFRLIYRLFQKAKHMEQRKVLV
ncbi:unnamed protein product [Caenorhabditis bovis]|uniref:Peptidase M13 C-terminal domain-containing protein n=1 Tax=Caenorhabditis bovis TaxID=2654633 RepID=A0A8S1EVT0_9PELO|nr:unnamed protein product [Caenorhabditis bovis]